MLLYESIFKIIKYKNFKIKHSIQVYQVQSANLTKIKFDWLHYMYLPTPTLMKIEMYGKI